MKKRDLITGLMLAIVFIAIALFICSKVESKVVRKGTIVEQQGNDLTIWDDTGNEWNYVTKEEFKDNQRVKVVINNNRTIDNLDDDVIIKVKRIK